MIGSMMSLENGYSNIIFKYIPMQISQACMLWLKRILFQTWVIGKDFDDLMQPIYILKRAFNGSQIKTYIFF